MIGAHPSIPFELIREKVLVKLNISIRELESRNRHPRLTLARRLIFRIAKTCTLMSYPEIARNMRRTSHSTMTTTDYALTRVLQNPRENMEAVLLVTAGGANPQYVGQTLGTVIERMIEELRADQAQKKGEAA